MTKPASHTGSAHSGPAPLDPYAGSSAAPAAVSFCTTSCKTLASCHLGTRTCETDCARPGVVQSCLGQAQGDCNRFAACWFTDYCRQAPVGSHSCAEAMTCDATCNGNQVCVCSCLQGLAPAHAAAYLALRRCVDGCAGNMQCIAKSCDAQLRRCRAE